MCVCGGGGGHARACVCVHVRACMRVCVHVCRHVCRHACMHAHHYNPVLIGAISMKMLNSIFHPSMDILKVMWLLQKYSFILIGAEIFV